MRRAIAVFVLLVLIVACAGLGTLFASDPPPRLWVVAPERIRVTPEAETWLLDVSALTLERPSKAVILKQLTCGTYDLSSALAPGQPLEVPTAVVRGVDAAAVDRWLSLRQKSAAASLRDSESAEFAALSSRMAAATVGLGSLTLVIDTARLPFEVADFQDYPLTLSLASAETGTSFTVTVAVRTLPSDPDWSPGDYHLHSSDFSDDAHKTLAQLAALLRDSGYKIGYITDHSDGIAARGWSAYTIAAANASIPGVTKLYPGAEITVGTGYPFVANGDVLAYGVNSLTGLGNQIYAPQTGIDNILNNYPAGPSSPGIAHPTGSLSWGDWTVLRYRGFELMSGILQTSFAETASPMVRWRSELTRLLPNTFTYGYLASARTGSDYHGLEPYAGYVTWIRTANWSVKGSVDSALWAGQSVASRKGGLAYMRMDYGATVAQVGGKLTGVPANSTLQIRVTIKPIETGSYTIKIYRDNNAQLIYTSTQSYTAGNTYNPFSPSTYLNYTFPGGSHYYFLYISGPDYIYTSPIFVKS